ncbi:MAG: hypothetical protein V1905_00565 [bacterium]
MVRNITVNNSDLSALPQNIAEFLISPELSVGLAKIAVKYGFSQDSEILDTKKAKTMREFTRLLMDVLRGDLPYESFEDLTKEILGFNDEVAKGITSDSEEMFFMYFKNDLKGLYREKQKVVELFGESSNSDLDNPTVKRNKKSLADNYREQVD